MIYGGVNTDGAGNEPSAADDAARHLACVSLPGSGTLLEKLKQLIALRNLKVDKFFIK
jgi:hypothetical protein